MSSKVVDKTCSEVAVRSVVSYFDDGREAYFVGENVDGCPYQPGTVRYHHWRSGYWDAMANDQFALEGVVDPFDYSHPIFLAADDSKIDRRCATIRMNELRSLLPEISEIENVIGPTESWKGNCYAVAEQLLNSGLLKPVIDKFGLIQTAYGIYHGDIAQKSVFARASIARHGWLELEEGIVIDPTYWVFVDQEPSIRVADLTDYDLGARRLLKNVYKNDNPPEFVEDDGVLRWSINDPEVLAEVNRVLGSASRMTEGKITSAQARWLANRPIGELGAQVASIYAGIEMIGLRAAIPLDNRRYVEGLQAGGSLSLK